MIPEFNCLSCGSCCRRIQIKDEVDFLTAVGLCLRLEERELFKHHPETIIHPYIGIKRKGQSKVKVLLYQMVSEPCPLLDLETNRCTVYDSRPMICRAYPFILIKNQIGIEDNCTSTKPFMENVVFGETEIEIGDTQRFAMIEQVKLFKHIQNMLNKNMEILIFDFTTETWIKESEIIEDNR